MSFSLIRLGLLLTLIFIFIFFSLLPSPIFAQAKEEGVIYNMTNLLTPLGEKCDKPPVDDGNILNKLITTIQAQAASLFGLFLGNTGTFQDANKLFSQSECLNSSYVPDQVQPKDSEPILDQQVRFIGKETGTMGVNLPDFADVKERNIKSDEKNYECSIVPCDQGVHPVIP